MLTQRALRRTSLLALFVLVWGLVFPSLANAGVGSANEVWSEICTAQGIKKIQQDPVGGHAASSHYTAEHCALCCLGGVLAAAEVPPLLAGVRIEPQVLVFPVSNAAPPQQFILLSAPPRAPPILSLA